MTDQLSLLDLHANAFRRDLGAAAARRHRRQRRVHRGVAIAVPLAVAATVAIAAWPGGQQVNVLDRAEAALTPRSGAVHFRVTSELLGARQPACIDQPIDVWLETGPNAPKSPSWRFRTNTSGCLTEPLPEALGHLRTGRVDTWWDGRDKSTYALDDGWVEHLTDTPARDAAFADPTQLGGGGGEHWWESTDPITNLRRLVAEGRVQPAGTGTIDGRRVRFLTGTEDVGGAAPKAELRIAVDADSFAPVEVTHQVRLSAEQKAKMPPDYGYGTRVRFLVYETAPTKDLTPEIPAGTDTASRDYREFRKAVRRAHAYPPEPASAAEQTRADQRFAELHPGVTPSPKP